MKGNRDFVTSDGVDKEQLTPALQQYFKFKEQYKGRERLSNWIVDYVLFFRMGDFYEFFFEDAIKISQILGIALTTRGKYKGIILPPEIHVKVEIFHCVGFPTSQSTTTWKKSFAVA